MAGYCRAWKLRCPVVLCCARSFFNIGSIDIGTVVELVADITSAELNKRFGIEQVCVSLIGQITQKCRFFILSPAGVGNNGIDGRTELFPSELFLFFQPPQASP